MKEKQREIWFDGRTVPLDRYDIWGLVNNSPVNKIVVSMMQRQNGRFPVKTSLITEINDEKDLSLINRDEIVLSSHAGLLDAAKNKGCLTCVVISASGGDVLDDWCRLAAMHNYAVVDFDLPTNIPLELFIARLQKRETTLLRRVETVTDMEVAFGVLEEGSDGVLFAGNNPGELNKLSGYLLKEETGRIKLSTLAVEEVRHIGMGWRACIDTTNLMSREEGMIIGSTSHGGIFVCSETHYLPYMNLRPFRVNAGAVHSYVWMPGNEVCYITELAAGSKVLCVNTEGKTRVLSVGRVKMEIRPLLLISGIAGGSKLNVVVQDDWHIRLMGAGGEPRNATGIKPGDELLSYVCIPGRHVGIKVDETIIEQ